MKKVKEPKQKKRVKASSVIFNIIFFGIIGFMVTYYVWNFIDIKSGYKYPTFGLRTSVIVSPSMAGVNDANTYITEDMEQIQQYDVVTTVNYNSFDEIQIYDIATYYDGSKDLICHRVVDKYEANGIQYVVFRGDANAVSDVPVSYDLVRGKVISITPKVGHAVAFIQSPYVFIAIFGIGFFVCLGLLIVGHKKDKKQVTAKETANETQVQEAVAQEQPVAQAVKPQEEQPIEEPLKETIPETETVEQATVVEEPQEQPQEVVQEEQQEENSAPAEEEKPVEEPVPVEPKKKEKKPSDKPKKEKAATPKKAKATPKAKPKPDEEKPTDKKEVKYRTYHVNKRKEDGKWTVKYAGGEKVIKLFDTQKEALEYAKKMADNQGGTVLVHASKGAQKGRIKKK